MKVFKKFFLTAACYLLTTVFLTGCAMFETKGGETTASDPLQSQALLRFSDIPIPLNFKLLPQESYSFESSGIRVALLRYQGKASLDRLNSFYKEQMPMFNWSLLNIIEYGDCMLNFEREGESCIININPKGSLAVVSISLGPKSQVLPKKSKQIVK
ncbi:MAG: hypothetical protein COT38_00270 [Candidatus Omnitrophica bacterium CG08_land_8_20_14_0_20_41_16]|uniref:Lipoprotein n=1 Tax=Candidatus Sherwoodlollariibacterium unditelluris TaxID=1974757 RepID=A0A2G9YH97_9BACT|nr:MAG: hypothetical protein COX41_07300 [Candidatus Omnitrophica bacterium CG23_combo_of_CG06-09_8_20_14_all_41_10]PIS34456.1 MAG: hypothetical protein COT38_00270 [Candidatus Omnitrophica bacterium CG08_land_8_20_14_0_20_41_16]